MPFDSDIVSMQEARDLAVAARDAQRIWAKASQSDVDRVCEAMSNAAYEASERLGAWHLKRLAMACRPIKSSRINSLQRMFGKVSRISKQLA